MTHVILILVAARVAVMGYFLIPFCGWLSDTKIGRGNAIYLSLWLGWVGTLLQSKKLLSPIWSLWYYCSDRKVCLFWCSICLIVCLIGIHAHCTALYTIMLCLVGLVGLVVYVLTARWYVKRMRDTGLDLHTEIEQQWEQRLIRDHSYVNSINDLTISNTSQ